MVGLKKSKQSILFSLLHDDKTENKSLQSMKDHPMIVLNTTTKHSEPVFLNVYDLLSSYRTTHCLLTYCSCHRLGVYHTSVQVYDVEYYYGDGICTCQPYSHVGRLVLSEKVGVTEMTKDEIETKILFDMFDRFTRKDYDLLRHNCNHFTNDLINRLVGKDLPMRFNRIERCITGTPCCSRTLKCMFGNDWTRPGIGISNGKQKICCQREARKAHSFED